MARRLAIFLGVALLASELGGAAGPPARAGTLGQREPPPDEGVVVVDSAGIVVGPLLGTRSGLAQVLMRAPDDRAIQLLVGRDQLASEEPAQFQSANCTGPPLIAEPLPGSSPPVVERAILGPLGEVLIAGGPPQTLLIGSELHTLFSLGCVTLGPPVSRSVRPTAVLPVIPFVAPFGVRSSP